jgi:hypothetical protein
MRARQNVWDKLKKIDPSLPEFSLDNFYKTLFKRLPHYFAEYGIFSMPVPQIISPEKVTKSSVFALTEVSMNFLKIGRIEHKEVKQWDITKPLDVLYLEGSVKIKGRAITKDSSMPLAENGFKNIIINEQQIKDEFNYFLSKLQALQNSIGKHPKEELIKNLQKSLEQSNQSSDAIQLAMVRIFKKMKKKPTLDEFKAEILAHEIRHFIDGSEENINQMLFKLKKTNSPIEYRKQNRNKHIHLEINPLIAQLRYGYDREYSLLRMITNLRLEDNSGEINFFKKKYSTWIIGHIIGLISENPKQYGIEISSTSSVSLYNQILSQLDMLFDKPDLFNSLCERLISIHNQNLKEDILCYIFPECLVLVSLFLD